MNEKCLHRHKTLQKTLGKHDANTKLSHFDTDIFASLLRTFTIYRITPLRELSWSKKIVFILLILYIKVSSKILACLLQFKFIFFYYNTFYKFKNIIVCYMKNNQFVFSHPVTLLLQTFWYAKFMRIS